MPFYSCMLLNCLHCQVNFLQTAVPLKHYPATMSSPSTSLLPDGSPIPDCVSLPYMLWHMMHMYPSEPKPVLWWSDDGLGVVIHEGRFKQKATDVYRKYLNTNSVTRFKRRLNTFGFRCRRRPHNSISEMWHPFFYKGMDTEMLEQVADKTTIGYAWNEGDASEIEDHMEDSTGSSTDTAGSISLPLEQAEACTSFDVANVKQEPQSPCTKLPLLEQVKHYDPMKAFSEHQASQRCNTINPADVILSGAALRACYSANDTSPHIMNIPYDELVHPPKAEAESSDPEGSDLEDPSWKPPKKKSSSNDADTEDDHNRDEKPKTRSRSNRKARSVSPVKAFSASPYKASIDKYYSEKRSRGRPQTVSVAASNLWAEEDRKRQEIERQKRMAEEREKLVASGSTPCNLNPAKISHCSKSLFHQQECPTFPFAQSTSHHQLHTPASYPAASPHIVLLPFMVTPRGYEPLVMPGGGIQAFSSSIAQLNISQVNSSAPLSCHNPILPAAPCCPPWMSSSHSDVQTPCSSKYPSPGE